MAESVIMLLGSIMKRMQIRLTDDQIMRLRAVAARRCVSMSQLIHQGVDMVLAHEANVSREDMVKRGIAAAGRHRSGCRDVAVHHDEHLGKAFLQ
jgi:predicted transcriptional regulator